MSVRVTEELHDSPVSQALVRESVAELRGRYGGREEPAEPPAADAFVVWLVVWQNASAVGCGGICAFDDDEAELKRMYVVPAMRGRGISRLLLGELEAAAARAGFGWIRLETGSRQPEAIGLYESAGYEPIPCWGAYVRDPDSVCLRKRLVTDGDGRR